jgi:hypothetical protein
MLMAPQIGGLGMKSIKSWNIIHKLLHEISCQIFFHFHFLCYLGLQASCKVEVYPQQSFTSDHEFSIKVVKGFQALM